MLKSIVRMMVCAGMVGMWCPVIAYAENAQAVFVRGDVRVVQAGGQRRVLVVGDQVRPGESLSAGADGYAHLRFPDGGFVGIRPGAQFVLEDYATDTSVPEGVRVRYRLDSGSVRAITGRVVEQNRSRFRLNTPVAAVGVRGTDYVVQATQDRTRASVNAGAIVVAPFGEGCAAAALGICETPAARTLTAGIGAAYIEYRAGAQAPEIKRSSAPRLLPVAPQEPSGSSDKRSDNGKGGNPPVAGGAGVAAPPVIAETSVTADTTVTATADRVVAALPPPPPPDVVWGRWSGIAAGTTTVVEQMDKGYKPWFSSDVFALLVRQLPTDMPKQGVVGFNLTGSEAYVRGTSGISGATVSDASLTVDFGGREFQTRLTVNGPGVNAPLTAEGRVDWQGNLVGDASRSTMNVLGVLGGTKASDAGYLFDKTMDAGVVLRGATSWRR